MSLFSPKPKLTNQEVIEITVSLDRVHSFQGLLQLNEGKATKKDFEGIIDDLYLVASSYRIGAGVKKNKDLATKYLIQAIDMGSGDAAELLGNIFEHDSWKTKNSYNYTSDQLYKLAEELWRAKAENGSSRAAFAIYNRYRTNDTKIAKEWSDRAIQIEVKNKNNELVKSYKKTIKHNELFRLKNFDLPSTVRNLEVAEKTPKEYLNIEEIKIIQIKILEKIDKITRDLNETEKEELERIRKLCKKEFI